MADEDKKGCHATAFFDGVKTSPSNWCRDCKANGVVFVTLDYYFPQRKACDKCGGLGIFPIEFDFRPSPFLIWVNPPIKIGFPHRGMIKGKHGDRIGNFLSGEIESG